MGRLMVVRVPPFYAQVLLTTREGAEHPGVDAGDERVSASPTAIAIGTVPDIDERGDSHEVEVEVWVDEAPSSDGWSLRIESHLSVTDWGVSVQDVVSTTDNRASVPPGDYECKVYSKPDGLAEAVRFVLTRT